MCRIATCVNFLIVKKSALNKAFYILSSIVKGNSSRRNNVREFHDGIDREVTKPCHGPAIFLFSK
jgi:hypothetical protein